jgi:hypothetical protein
MGRGSDVFLHRYCDYALFLAPENEPHSCYYTQAKNVVNYLRIIHQILAPGGVWINLGMESMSMSRASVDSEPLQVLSFGTLRKTPQATPRLNST